MSTHAKAAPAQAGSGHHGVQLGGEHHQHREHTDSGQGHNRLVALAAEIRAAHVDAAAAVRTSLAHAIAAGERLIEARALVRHGEWLPWLSANIGFSQRTAQLYIRLAKNKAKIEKCATVADLGIRAAVDAITVDDPGRAARRRLLPLEGHIRIGVDDDGGREIWIAPSRHHPGYVFITCIKGTEIIGSRRPVEVSWAGPYFEALGLGEKDFEWHDEEFPEWSCNILLFDSVEQWIDTADLFELLELLKYKEAGRLGEPEKHRFQTNPFVAAEVSMHQLVFRRSEVSA